MSVEPESPAPSGEGTCEPSPTGQEENSPTQRRRRLFEREQLPKLSHCLNCGHDITGNFCSHCGQEAEDHRTTVRPLVEDALDEFLRWDSKLLRTVIPLLFQPGQLTNEYNAGKRVSYISPFKLYLTVSVVFFLFLSMHARSLEPVIKVHTSSANKHALVQAHVGLTKAKVRLEKSLANPAEAAAAPALKAALGAVDTASADVGPKSKASAAPAMTPAGPGYASYPRLFALNSGIAHLPGVAALHLDCLPATVDEYDALQTTPAYPYKNSALVRHVIRQVYFASKDSGDFTREIFGMMSKAMFVLLPFFALLLYGIYWRSRRYYVEHIVFALHCHTFTFLVLTAMLFVPAVAPILLLAVLPAYYIAAMRRVYHQSLPKTIAKFMLAGFSYSAVLLVGFILTVLLAFIS